MKQWQESLEMIVKRLQLSELHNKIMEEVNTFEINLDRMTSDLNQPQQLFHCKEDLENHIQNLKVSIPTYFYLLYFIYLVYGKYAENSHATFHRQFDNIPE